MEVYTHKQSWRTSSTCQPGEHLSKSLLRILIFFNLAADKSCGCVLPLGEKIQTHFSDLLILISRSILLRNSASRSSRSKPDFSNCQHRQLPYLGLFSVRYIIESVIDATSIDFVPERPFTIDVSPHMFRTP